MDVYIVADGARIVDVSARLQGAELIRTDEAKRLANTQWASCGRDPAKWANTERAMYNRLTIETHRVQDLD